MPSLSQSADIRFGWQGSGFAIAVTSSSAATQLTGSGGRISDANSGRIYQFKAVGGAIYGVFGPSGCTVDNTATSGNTCPTIVISDGETIEGALPDTSRNAGGAVDQYLAVKTASGTATLYISPKSGA